MENNYRAGLGLPAVIGIIALILIGGAMLLWGGGEEADLAPENDGFQEETALPASKPTTGSSAGVQNYTKAAYDAANAAGKLIIVFFDSPACGEQCPREIPLMKAAFAQYAGRPIAGFIADINQEKAFANGLKVYAPSGKAVVFNNKLEAWSPVSWRQFDYENYIEIYTYGSEDE